MEPEITQSTTTETIVSSSDINNFIELLKMAHHLSDQDKIYVDECNNKQQDLLHDLEIPEKLYAKDITNLGRQIRNLRKARRRIKDELLIVQCVDKWLQQHPNMLQDLEQLRDSLIESEKHLKDRSYTIKSTLFTTTELENKKIKNNMKTVLSIATKILKKWSPEYEIVQETSEDTVHTDKSHTISYSLTNMNFNESVVKSTFNNFYRLISKEVGSLMEVKDAKLTIADMPLRDATAKRNKLMSKITLELEDGTIYIFNGAITYKYTRPPSKSKPRRKR